MNNKMGSNIIYILGLITIVLNVVQSEEYIRTKRRMYAMCPPKFQRIGSECYHIGNDRVSWMEAHFECKDKNSKLAEPIKLADRKIRVFLQKNDFDLDDIWIGSTWDWTRNTWIWGSNNKNLTYHSFRRIEKGSSENLAYQCAVLDPTIKYRWSPRPCVDKHRYICQHKMPKVSAINRIKVYNRWNQTYPNQLANEVVLEIVDNAENNGARTRRVKAIDANEEFNIPIRIPQRIIKRRPGVTIRTTSVPNYITNEINSEYLPIFPLTVKDPNAKYAPEETKLTSTVAPKISAGRLRDRTEFDKAVEKKRRLERQMRRKQRKEQREKNQKLKAEQLSKKIKIEEERNRKLDVIENYENEVQREREIEFERKQEEHQRQLENEEKRKKHEENRIRLREEELFRLNQENAAADAAAAEEDKKREQDDQLTQITPTTTTTTERAAPTSNRKDEQRLHRIPKQNSTHKDPLETEVEKPKQHNGKYNSLIRERLKKLSPEDRQKFWDMKKRKNALKRQINEATIPSSA